MKENYGTEIIKTKTSKGLKEFKTLFLVSLGSSILLTLLAIEYVFSFGIKAYSQFVLKKFWYTFKVDYFPMISTSKLFRPSPEDIEMNLRIDAIWQKYLPDSIQILSFFIISFCIILPFTYYITRKFGEKFQSKKFERSDELQFVSPKELQKEIKAEVKRANNDLEFTNEDLKISKEKIRIPFGTASTHFGFCGASKTGKTNGINELLIQDRAINSKCLIVDPRGQFFAKHGRKGDKILSLFDIRQEKWDFWCEKIAFKFLADALVEVKESSNQTKFFDKSGREVLAAVLKNTKSIEELWQVVNYDEESLHDFLIDKKELSKQLLGKKASGQSAGIIATSILNMSFIKSMNHHVHEREKISGKEEKFFSLTEWVNDDTDDSWVFIIDDIRNLPEAQPLHRLWFDIVTSTAYDRDINKPNLKQINLYCDEITTVGNLPTLPSVLDKGRNFRLRLIIGFQSYAQLEIIYGKEGATNIFQGLQSVFIFASNNEAEARIFSERMGRSTIIEVDQSLGLNGKNNNANLSYRTRQIDNVTASQIQALKDNFCFLKLARFNPTKIEFKFHKMETINIASNSIVPSRTRLDDVEIKPYESQEKLKEKEEKIAQEKQNNKFLEVNNLVKSIVEEVAELLSSKTPDQTKIDQLAAKILERFGNSNGFKAKFGEIYYAINIFKPKKLIYLSSNDFELAIPFPKIKFKQEDEELTSSEQNKTQHNPQTPKANTKPLMDDETLTEDEMESSGIKMPLPLSEELKFTEEKETEKMIQNPKFKSVPIKLKKQVTENSNEYERGI